MDQTPPAPVPPSKLGAKHQVRERRTGRLLVGSGSFNLMQTLVIVVLLLVIAQLSGANNALVGALTQQRDQFTACKDKPATVRGCSAPVAAEPSVIVKQAGAPIRIPGIPGADGKAGLAGRDGRDGVDGTNGVTPPCMRTPRQCAGADGKPAPVLASPSPGKDGRDGKDAADGKDGADGITPACWFEAAQCRGADGKDGAMGVQGTPGVSVGSTQCVTDDTPAGSHWLITYKDGAKETSPGPCRIVGP